MDGIKLSESQKTCHFIAFWGNRRNIPSAFFDKWGMQEKSVFSLNGDTIMQYQFESKLQLYPGNSDNTININGRTSYVYHLIIIEFSKVNITAIGFPVKYFAVTMGTQLTKQYGLMINSTFVKANLNSIVHEIEVEPTINFEQKSFTLGGLFLTQPGHKFVSKVRLMGENPLKSDIYNGYFKEKLNKIESEKDNKDEIGVEKIVLKCQFDILDTYKKIIHRSTSSMHIDKFGNYKFYIQKQGKNILAVLGIFRMLHTYSCLESRSSNPVSVIENDDNE